MNSRYSASDNVRAAQLYQLPGGAAGVPVPDNRTGAGNWAVLAPLPAPPATDRSRFPEPVVRPHKVVRRPNAVTPFLDVVELSQRKSALPIVKVDITRNVRAPYGIMPMGGQPTRLIGRQDVPPKSWA